jgi:inosine/xanthosine triphosphate pyrophosphatase family protein/dephospho-CoA kinase
MRELTFFTSNATKLAHARYIAERFAVRIKGFRQRTYHANYDEPRLLSRTSLLDASYRSAIRQCAKAGIAIDSHPFILEDTSVRIDAISTEDQEVPGLDIKYWMQEQTFELLDSVLRAHDNNRRATVRSDVLLHVPRNLKALWGIDADYVVFVGEQAGHIVERESRFDTNLVYPWLDNQSFNRWFQPEGAERPFGAMSVADANRFDFRRKSFVQLFNFLVRQQNYFTAEYLQLEFALDDKPNLVLCGYPCAGKTTGSQHLARKFGYLHVEASDFMYLNYYYRHGYSEAISIGDFAEQALSQKPEIAAEKVADHIISNPSAPFVVSGFRAPEEIAYLKRALATRGKSFDVVFIEANETIRFERLQTRMRPGDNISISQFRARDEQQKRMGLGHILECPVLTRIENVGTISDYLRAVDGTVGRIPEDAIVVTDAVARLSAVKDVKLEEAILIALLGAWSEDETRPFFSTTRIAKMIGQIFKNAVPKHKDNVSRYFNQDFYAYYEISTSEGLTTRKYRLSNTGYGMAVRALRELIKSRSGPSIDN